jgi:hypothetical protein
MVHLVITHGRSHEFDIPALTQRPLEEAVRFGLQRIGSPHFATIPVSLAFYGDHWRPDAGELDIAADSAMASPTDLQQAITGDILSSADASPAFAGDAPESSDFATLNGLATLLDQHLHLGDAVVRFFLDDVESYFGNDRLRGLALDRVEEAVTAAGDDVILLGHSLGSVVTYDFLRERPGRRVVGFITLGSPLGLPTVRRRIAARQFPADPARWVNVLDPRDLVTGREPLRGHYPSADGRAVEDRETEGMAPGITDLTAPHDGKVYLSSVALARALGEMIDTASGASPLPPP